MNTLDTAKAVLAAFEARDLKATAALLADDFELTGPAPVALNKDQYLVFQAIHNEGFTDWRFNIKEAHAEGDKAYVSIQITATHNGVYDVSKIGVPIPPLQPTDKSRAWPVEHLTVTVKDGKVRQLYVKNEPAGGVMGTLEWLGVRVPAPNL